MIGRIVGNYKIIEKIGEGGMGAVYRGLDLMLEREVAIKVLRTELASQPQVVERFRSEAVTLAKLNHPNIAALYSFFRQGDDFFMVMEYLQGKTLDRVLSERGRFPYTEAIPLFCHALEGVGYANRRGIIHRDIKPANMMLTDEGVLKVMDFGIARVLGTARMTRAGHLIGTIEYMSPEQVRGQETDARSDIYSLGMLLYEMLTGRVPFPIENEFELMRAQIERMPTPPRQIVAEIPESIEAAIMRAVAKDPAERFQSAADFRAALLVDEAAIFSTAQRAKLAAISEGSQTEADQHAAPGATIKPTVIAPGFQPGEQVRETRFVAEWTPPAQATTSATSNWPAKKIAFAGAGAFALLLVISLAAFLSLGTRSDSPAEQATQPAAAPPPSQSAPPVASPEPTTFESKAPGTQTLPASPSLDELQHSLPPIEEITPSVRGETTRVGEGHKETKRTAKQPARAQQETRAPSPRRRPSHQQQVEELMRLP